MNVNRRSWMTTDDYLAEKEGMQRATSPLAVTARPQQYRRTGSKYSNPAILVTTPKASEPVIKNGVGRQSNSIIQPGSEFSMSLTPQNLPKSFEFAKSENTLEQPLTQQQVNAQLTTAYTSQQMNEALQSLVDFNNRKFKYNAKESPLYTILEQQAAEEARLASGRAYARSVANTGGYGSSYATLAAEEASRQVMEGMNDQQYALYQAAKDEFEAERQSRLDWYNMTKQMHEDAMMLEEYEKLRTDEAATEMDANTQAATEYLQAAYGTAYSEGAMKNDLLAKGYTEEEANAALEAQRKVAGAVVTDYTASSVSDAISNANTLQQAYANKYLTTEEYDAAVKKNAAVIMDNANAAMKNLDDADYTALGITAEEWEGMDEGDRKLEVMDRIGQLVKEGVVPHSDYYKMLYKDLEEEFGNKEYTTSDDGVRFETALGSAIIIEDLYNNGYLLQDEYTSLMYGYIGEKMLNLPGVTNFVEKIKKWQEKLGTDVSKKKYKQLYGNAWGDGAFVGYMSNMSGEEEDMVMKMANWLAKDRKPTMSVPKKKGAT